MCVGVLVAKFLGDMGSPAEIVYLWMYEDNLLCLNTHIHTHEHAYAYIHAQGYIHTYMRAYKQTDIICLGALLHVGDLRVRERWGEREKVCVHACARARLHVCI